MTGENAEKARAAALAELPGAKVLRVEEAHHGEGYVVHIEEKSGMPRPVFLTEAFKVQPMKDCGPPMAPPPAA